MLIHVARSLRTARPAAHLTLLMPGPMPSRPSFTWKSFRYAIKDALKAVIGRPRLKKSPDDTRAQQAAEVVERMTAIYPQLVVRYNAGLDDGLDKAAAELGLDAIAMVMRSPKPRPACALIGYVPDYQHRHLPHLFSAKERAERDQIFGQLIATCDTMVMNAKTVADDMRRFTPGSVPPLKVLPFSPKLEDDWLVDRTELCAKYAVGGLYYIICNQFWMHKDHLTAFRAMAEVARRNPDVSLVCTGGTADYRDPTYFAKLEAEATALGLGQRLRFLGHIPKRDQIELLKHAVALVQPTLFEGGPGGGSTYEAVALGQRVLLTDLAVNREVDDGDVRFFPPGDHVSLARLMEEALKDSPTRRSLVKLRSKSDARLERNGREIWAAVMPAVAKYRARQS